MEASGLPYRIHMYNIAEMPPAIPASMVFTATEPIRSAPLPDAPSVEPGLNPNQPNARMKQPVSTMTMSWPGIALRFAVAGVLSDPRPDNHAHASAVRPPTECTTPEPAKSHIALAQAEVRAEIGQPAAAPGPVREQRIYNGAHHERD